MATTNHYDLIVLGAEIAGLVAAALAARRGKRVLVMPLGTATGTYRLGSHILDFEDVPVVHMGTPPVRRVFAELGLMHQVRREHGPIDGPVHFALADERIDLAPAEADLVPRALRAWPTAAVEAAWDLRARWIRAVDELFDELLDADASLVADGFWSRRFLARVEAQLPGPATDELEPLQPLHPLRDVPRAVEPWLAHLARRQLGKAAALRLGGLWSRGPEDVPEGLRRVRRTLLQRIELHSGDVKPDLRVAEILTRRGRVSGIALLGKRDHYGCDHLIVASDPRELLRLGVDTAPIPRAAAHATAPLHTAALRVTLHAVVRDVGLSPAIAGPVVVTPDDVPDDDPRPHAPLGARHGDALAVHDERGAGVGASYVRVGPGPSEDTRHVRITRVVAPDEPLDDLRELVLDELDERGVLPFIHDHVLWMHSPHDGREVTDGHGRVIPGLGTATAMNATPPAIYGAHEPPSLGIGLLPLTTAIRNLVLASRATLPGLGLEGEFAAGAMAAGLTASAGRSPFRRPILLGRV